MTTDTERLDEELATDKALREFAANLTWQQQDLPPDIKRALYENLDELIEDCAAIDEIIPLTEEPK